MSEKDLNLIKVSVIVPSYKRKGAGVERALNSLLNQTHENLEIVLVDDNGREDLIEYRNGLIELVEKLNSDKIVYIQNPENLGGSLSRNKGLKAAGGEYITFLDDDDRYLPDKVGRQLSFMVENGLDVSFTDLGIYNEKEKLTDYREYSGLSAFDEKSLFRYHLTRQITGTPTFMCRKEILEQTGGFEDVCMGQEYYLMSKLIQSGCRIGYLPGSDVVAYRTAAEAISTGKNKIIGQKKLYAYKKKHFDLLRRGERRFVRARHYAVMAVAYKRNKRYVRMLLNLFIAFVASPINAVKEAAFFFGRRKKNKKTGV